MNELCNDSYSMEPIKKNHRKLASSCSIRRKYFARKSHCLFVASSESDSVDLNDKTVDFILVSTLCNNDVVDADGLNARRVFEEEMIKMGLFLEEDVVGELVFVKIHAPINVLRKYCGIMKLRMPIKKRITNNQEKDGFDDEETFKTNNDRFGRFISIFMSNVSESKILTAEYTSESTYLFDENDPDFFSEEVRTLVIDFILNKINWGRDKSDLNTVGFQSLLDKGVYKAAFSLHDGYCDSEDSCRHELFTEWASVNKCLQGQPIDLVKEYMGVKYAFYFAWLGFYTYMLVIPTVMSVIVVLYGIITLPSCTLSSDICRANETLMCPSCDNICDYWVLSSACWYGKLSYILNNDSTVVFAFFMSIWATLFLEMWKRYASRITHHWGLTSINLDSQQSRPRYLARLSNYNHTKNEETGEYEPIIPLRKKITVLFMSYSVLLIFLMIVIAFHSAVVIIRMAVISSSLAKDYGFTNIKLFISFTSGIINLFCIQLLNCIYGKIAVFLTEIELPRTQQEFDETLQVKIYIFKFINCYTSIIYLAFWKGKWIGYPGSYSRILNYRQEECGPGGCLIELSIQLFIIMVGQQVLDTVVETIYPMCVKWIHSRTVDSSRLKKQNTSLYETSGTETKPWVKDYKLLDLGPRGLLPEYMEMVLQYGFVTLFATAFPPSAFFALFNNVFELRLDAKKFLTHYRRPIPHRVPDIGVWYRILDVIGIISVLTNAIIIAFNTDIIPRWVFYANVNHAHGGFLNYSLAYFDVNDFFEKGLHGALLFTKYDVSVLFMCFVLILIVLYRYQDYRGGKSDNYKRTTFYYQLLSARLLFIVLFQNFVYLLKIIIQWMIPDIPKSLRDRIKRESYLITRLIMEKEPQRENLRNHQHIK